MALMAKRYNLPSFFIIYPVNGSIIRVEKHVSELQFWKPFFDIPLRFLRRACSIALLACASLALEVVRNVSIPFSKALGIVWTTEIIEGKMHLKK